MLKVFQVFSYFSLLYINKYIKVFFILHNEKNILVYIKQWLNCQEMCCQISSSRDLHSCEILKIVIHTYMKCPQFVYLVILIIVISQNFCNIVCFDNILTMQYIFLVYAVSCLIFLFAVFIVHLLLHPTFIWVHCPWKLCINLKRYQKVYKSRFLKWNRLSQRKSTRNK